jgi:hypothetical protein
MSKSEAKARKGVEIRIKNFMELEVPRRMKKLRKYRTRSLSMEHINKEEMIKLVEDTKVFLKDMVMEEYTSLIYDLVWASMLDNVNENLKQESDEEMSMVCADVLHKLSLKINHAKARKEMEDIMREEEEQEMMQIMKEKAEMEELVKDLKVRMNRMKEALELEKKNNEKMIKKWDALTCSPTRETEEHLFDEEEDMEKEEMVKKEEKVTQKEVKKAEEKKKPIRIKLMKKFEGKSISRLASTDDHKKRGEEVYNRVMKNKVEKKEDDKKELDFKMTCFKTMGKKDKLMVQISDSNLMRAFTSIEEDMEDFLFANLEVAYRNPEPNAELIENEDFLVEKELIMKSMYLFKDWLDEVYSKEVMNDNDEYVEVLEVWNKYLNRRLKMMFKEVS